MSFISLRLVLTSVIAVAAPRAKLVCLIKPQFEVGPAQVVKGIVRNTAARREACTKIEALLREAGWQIAGLIESPIQGAAGNHEYLIGAMR